MPHGSSAGQSHHPMHPSFSSLPSSQLHPGAPAPFGIPSGSNSIVGAMAQEYAPIAPFVSPPSSSVTSNSFFNSAANDSLLLNYASANFPEECDGLLINPSDQDTTNTTPSLYSLYPSQQEHAAFPDSLQDALNNISHQSKNVSSQNTIRNASPDALKKM